jgi:hypothetical protein
MTRRNHHLTTMGLQPLTWTNPSVNKLYDESSERKVARGKSHSKQQQQHRDRDHSLVPP